MLSHHTWSPSAPLIKVVAQGMPASEPKWLFFWRPFQAKRCNNIELGEGGTQVSSQSVWQDCCFWPMDVQTQAWTNSLVHLPQPQSKHTLIFKAATQQAKKHKTYFFGLWLCKRKLEQIPFCTCQNPNPNALSSSQLLPTNKGCASTPPEAELHKLRVLHSARTVRAL